MVFRDTIKFAPACHCASLALLAFWRLVILFATVDAPSAVR